MRQWAGLLTLLLLGALGGCVLPEPARPTSWLQRMRPANNPLGNNYVQMDVALLECPAGDSFVNGELWSYTDEQVVSLEKRAALEENGFRVGQIVGLPSRRFLDLLTFERSCINPRRRFVQPGYVAAQALGTTIASLNFQISDNGLPVDINLEQAQCFLDVVPTLTEDGRTRLRFRPRVEYGQVQPEFQPVPDQSGWTVEMKRPAKTFPDLEWEVTVAPNEYLIIGARPEKARSLAVQAFLEEGSSPIQRLLVIRTNRSQGDAQDERLLTLEDLGRMGRSPPLALQATLTSARACGQ
jgi:hypothetical protein